MKLFEKENLILILNETLFRFLLFIQQAYIVCVILYGIIRFLVIMFENQTFFGIWVIDIFFKKFVSLLILKVLFFSKTLFVN